MGLRWMMCGTCAFYFVLMEQYYTGEMYFPPINPVDDGFFVFVLGCLVTGIFGSEELFAAEWSVFGEKMRFGHICMNMMCA
jgi:hypothetical protein